MNIHIYHHHTFEPFPAEMDLLSQIRVAQEQTTNQLAALQTQLNQHKESIMIELDTLTAQVQANTDVENSAIALIQGLAGQIAALKTDPAALQALSDKLKASADNLAAAIIANTPAQ